MEPVIHLLLLLLLLITLSAGARLLDEDSTSHKKSTSSDPNFTKSSLTHSDAESAVTAEILQKESVPVDHEEHGRAQNDITSPVGVVQMNTQSAYDEEIVSSGQSPTVGHISIQSVHVEGILSSGQSPGVGHMSIQNAHNKGMPFSGQSPANTGEMSVSVQDAHIEGMLSSGQSPGVGHMSVDHSHIEGKLSSGQSPGVGHMSIQNAHIKGMLISFGHSSEVGHVIEEMLPTGDNPGVGHMSVQNVPKEQILSPTGSPDRVGHMGVEEILSSREIDSEKKMSTVNKLPSGSSPGVGHMVINTRHKRKGHATGTLNKVPLRPEADNPSALGHVEKMVVTEDKMGHVKESETSLWASEGEMGSMESMGAGEHPEDGHSAGEERKNGEEIIGCGGVGVGQPSGSINLFNESSYYGAPTSLVFGITGKDRES